MFLYLPLSRQKGLSLALHFLELWLGPPYPSSRNFTSTPAGCRQLDCQLSFRFLAFSPFSAPPLLGEGGGLQFSSHPAARPWGQGYVGLSHQRQGLRTSVLH